MNLTNLRLNDCIQTQKIDSVLFHLYKVEKWTKLWDTEVKRDGVLEVASRRGLREVSEMLAVVFSLSVWWCHTWVHFVIIH